MKFAVFAWVAAAACVVVVCGQLTTEGDERCDSPDVDLENVAKQTTLTGVAKVLNEVKESTLTNMAQVLNQVKTAVANLNPRNPNCETPSQINLNANPVVLLRDYCLPVLIQQHIRGSGSGVFNRSWEEYKAGFNDSSGNFWLGNELLHQLTKLPKYKLRFELRLSSYSPGAAYSWRWVEYNHFVVAGEEQKYHMRARDYSGNLADGFITNYDGSMFSTYDRDNDSNATHNCAAITGGGFWWNACAGRDGVKSVNTQISGGFGWNIGTNIFNLLISRMWLTC